MVRLSVEGSVAAAWNLLAWALATRSMTKELPLSESKKTGRWGQHYWLKA
jgi:hypothetical protein